MEPLFLLIINQTEKEKNKILNFIYMYSYNVKSLIKALIGLHVKIINNYYKCFIITIYKLKVYILSYIFINFMNYVEII